MSPHATARHFAVQQTVAENNVRLAAIADRLLHYESFYTPSAESSVPSRRLRARQQCRTEPGFPGGRLGKSRVRQNLLRQDDRFSHGSSWLGPAYGLSPLRRRARGDGAEPHDALPASSARNGPTAGEEAGRSHLFAREHRYQHRHRTLLSVHDGCHPPDGTRTARPERAAAGRASARARGKTGGRPRTDVARLKNAKVLYENSGKTADEVCKAVGVGRRIFFAYLAQQRDQLSTHLAAN